MAKSIASKLEPREFGDYSRDRIVDILKRPGDAKSRAYAPIAATLLACLDTQGPRPGNDVIATALDTLARTDTAIAHDLLWQAAEHARNARVRVEAIRRSGPIATAERSTLLRKWAKEGFQPIVNFQHDQIDLNSIREAAITAIGQVKHPSNEDIETIVEALTPPANQAQFSPIVFNAACDAYWSAGDVASLPNLIGLISKRWRGDTGASLAGLAAKFSVKELKAHAAELRKAFLESAAEWPNDPARASRLVELAERLATPEFFQEWTARYGGDGLEHGRGQVSLKLLEGFGQLTEGIVKGLLILARWPRNLLADGPVVKGLQRSVGAGHGHLVAETLIPQGHDGRRSRFSLGAQHHIEVLVVNANVRRGEGSWSLWGY